MASKRDFGRAFDNPVGLHVVAEPQASPVPYIPGQWPEEVFSNINEVAPTPATSFFSTLARFTTSITLKVCNIPERLRKRFARTQQIIALPVIREDGSSKRRLIDAGLAPVTPTCGGSQLPDVTRTPSLWIETPPTPGYNPPQYSEDLQDDDIDDSLDWSMDDVDTSTPPHNPKTGSPSCMGWLRRSERRILTPKMRIISPNSQFNILRDAPVTPMRKQLLKKQLRAVESVTLTSPILRQPDHTLASPHSPTLAISDLKKKALKASVLNINAPAVAAKAQQANAQYKAELEARENQAADAQTTTHHLEYMDPAEVFNNDLSYLPDTRNLSSTFESLHTPSPSPSRRKSIRWAPQGRVKSYYVDERISEMLDSTLESIRSPIPKPNFRDDDEDGDSSDDLQGVILDDPESTSDSEDSVDGPSLDHSLEESQLSKELLQDLEEDFKNLLAQQPPPPSPPKPLIAPLSDSERTQLEDIAIKSKHGRNESYPILPDKIFARDFGTLLPHLFNGSAKAWLNDEIVNQYLAIIVKTLNDDCGFVYKRGGPAPPYHAFSSHWYSSIKGGVKKVERWAGRVGLGGKQFLDAKVILFPICDGSHWRLLAVKPQERTLEYLDSLGWDGSTYIRKLREYLQHELKGLYNDEEWTFVELQRSSRQLNGSDCGVFVLLNALVVLQGQETSKVMACNGMQEARERLAMTIITGNAVELEY